MIWGYHYFWKHPFPISLDITNPPYFRLWHWSWRLTKESQLNCTRGYDGNHQVTSRTNGNRKQKKGPGMNTKRKNIYTPGNCSRLSIFLCAIFFFRDMHHATCNVGGYHFKYCVSVLLTWDLPPHAGRPWQWLGCLLGPPQQRAWTGMLQPFIPFQLSHEKKDCYFPLYWLFNRDPYNSLL